MTDTQKGTLSVSREDLAILIEAAGSKERISIRRHEVMFKLRAILAQTSCATPDGSACPGDGVGRCKACPVTDEPQDEPVAWINNEALERVKDKFGSYYLAPKYSDEDNTPLYLRPAAQAVEIEMADVVRATMAVDGCPVLTSNQCYAIAQKLNAKLNGIQS